MINLNQTSIKDQLRVDKLQIHKIIKQRYPFIFVDRILEFEIGKDIHGIKNVSLGCSYYDPETGTIPLFVIFELMGQLSEVLLRLSYDLSEKKGLLAGIQGFEINNHNAPYDNLNIKNEMLIATADMYKTKSAIFINNQLLCQGIFIHVFRK